MRKIVKATGLLMALALITAGCVPAGEAQDGGTSLIFMVLFMVGIFAVFYFIMVRPQRRRQKEHDALVQELKKGDRVITAGGIYGQIESTGADSIVIKVESGATLRVARVSVIGKQESL